VQAVGRQARDSRPFLEPTLLGTVPAPADGSRPLSINGIVTGLEALTPARIVVFQALREDSLFALTDSGPELTNDPTGWASSRNTWLT